MVAVLEKFGVRIPYPENWSVEEGANPHWPESLSIESPGGAFWQLSIHADSEDLTELASSRSRVLVWRSRTMASAERAAAKKTNITR